MPTAFHNSIPQIFLQRKKGILSRGQALSGRRPRVEILRVQDVARCWVLQPVHVLDGGHVQAEESGTTAYHLEQHFQLYEGQKMSQCNEDLFTLSPRKSLLYYVDLAHQVAKLNRSLNEQLT